MTEHIAGEDLAAFVDGALASEARTGVEAHLSRCRNCREALVEIVAIQGSREKVPSEFLRNALNAVPPRSDAIPAAGTWNEKDAPLRRVLPLRQVFGVAAVFLVAVLIGYVFLGRGRSGTARIAEKEMPQPGVAAEDRLAPTKPVAGVPAGETRAERSANFREGRAPEGQAEAFDSLLKDNGTVAEKAGAASRKTEPATAPKEAERLQASDEADEMPGAKKEEIISGGIVGGVLGGVEAAPEKDKVNERKPAAAATAAPLPQASADQRQEEAKLRQAPPSRGKGMALDQKRQVRRGPFPEDASVAATQMLLTVTGQAAAPLAIGAQDRPAQGRLHIEGDVGRSDLLDPGQLDGWEWLPEGLSLELQIAADGAVTAVTPLGEWEPAQAANAVVRAMKMTFSESARITRRAILKASGDPN